MVEVMSAPLDNEPTDLIPTPTTEVDHKVNEAYRQATGDGARRYVYTYRDHLYVTNARPASFPCVAVDPAGWAIWLAVGADETELG